MIAQSAKITTVTAAEAEAVATLKKARAEAEARIISADAEAQAVIMAAEAETDANTMVAASLTDDLVEYRLLLALYATGNCQPTQEEVQYHFSSCPNFNNNPGNGGPFKAQNKSGS